MPERFRGELLTIGRYTNPASFIFYLLESVENLVNVCGFLTILRS